MHTILNGIIVHTILNGIIVHTILNGIIIWYMYTIFSQTGVCELKS